MRNTDIVKAFIETNGREGLSAAIAAHGASDMTWWTPGTGDIGDKIRMVGDIMHAHYTDDGMVFTITALIGDGDLVTAEYEGHATLKDGRAYNNHFHVLFELHDGLITAVREYHDSARADPIWGPIFAVAFA